MVQWKWTVERITGIKRDIDAFVAFINSNLPLPSSKLPIRELDEIQPNAPSSDPEGQRFVVMEKKSLTENKGFLYNLIV